MRSKQKSVDMAKKIQTKNDSASAHSIPTTAGKLRFCEKLSF